MSRFAKLRLLVIALLPAAALAACAGAGDRSALPMSPAAAPAGATAAATPNPWPSAGASFVYGGTLVQKATGSKATTLDLTQNVSTTAAKYKGHRVTDYHGVAQESGKGSNLKTTFDAYVSQTASSIRKGSDVELVKTASNDSSGLSESTVYGKGNGTFDQVPEVPQARWNNTAARTESISDSAAGSSSSDTYSGDGSYDENAVPVAGLVAMLQSYADANAVYQFPFEGGSMNSTITFSPPSGGKLSVLFVNAAAHVTQLYTLRAWYPAEPPVLASDSFRDAGSVTLPSACKVPKTYGKTAIELVEQTTRLDIVYGEYETLQRSAYVAAPYGLVCSVVHDDLKTYYSYTTLTLASKPLTETVSDETLWLRQAHVPKNSGVAALSAALPLDVPLASWHAARRLKAERAIFESLRHLRKSR